MILKFKTDKKIIALGDKGQEIGYLDFGYSQDASNNRNIDIIYMHVKPEYRKMHIGSAMIKFLIDNKPDVVWISLWTGKEMERIKGNKFYIKNGFKKMCHHKDYYEKGIGTTLFARKINERI